MAVPKTLRGAAIASAIAVALAAVSAQAADPQGDAAQGARLFLQCRACHVVTKDAQGSVGPNLYGVMGSKAGTRTAYVYSKDLAASGIVWTPVTMDQWLRQPTSLVPGAKMAFQGVAAPKARADLIAYLETLGAPATAGGRR